MAHRLTLNSQLYAAASSVTCSGPTGGGESRLQVNLAGQGSSDRIKVNGVTGITKAASIVHTERWQEGVLLMASNKCQRWSAVNHRGKDLLVAH